MTRTFNTNHFDTVGTTDTATNMFTAHVTARFGADCGFRAVATVWGNTKIS